MCGGTADTDLDSFEEVSLEDKEVMSDAQEESQNEYKESETTEEETPTTFLEKKIFWGATDAKPEVYAAEDVFRNWKDCHSLWR